MTPKHEHLLLAYVDGRLDTSGRQAVDALLADRPELRKELADLERLQRRLHRTLNSAAMQPLPSTAIWQRLDQHLAQRAGIPIRRKYVWTTAIPLVMSIVLLVVVGFWLNSREQNRTTVGSIRRVMQVPYVYQPHVAVNPNNPDHVVAVATSSSESDCSPITVGSSCEQHLILSLSSDGGNTWEDRQLNQFDAFGGNVGFGPDGKVYVAGVLARGGIFVYRLESENVEPTFKYTFPTLVQGATNPWLTIDQRTGTLYIAYSGPTGRQGVIGGILLQRSTDGAESWSDPVVVTPGPVVMQGVEQVALPLVNGQVMLHDNGQLAVTWMAGVAIGQPNAEVWIATSTDGGRTFARPQRLDETWTYTATAYGGDTYHILYQSGTEQQQELTVATSGDGGRTWATASVSGDIPLFYGNAPAPGVGISEDGTIDVTFYAPTHMCSEGDALSMAVVNRTSWVDPCTYHVYYTWSKDNGRTWAKPERLSQRPIEGQAFVRVQGYSRPGQYIGTASTNTHAYAIWIDGTEAYLTRIQR